MPEMPFFFRTLCGDKRSSVQDHPKLKIQNFLDNI